jgi:UDP-N-acetylglucosamine:LPS N-acetylglucosamine transferase
MGGSQGAQALNAAVSQHVQELLQCADIIHLTGKGKEAADPQAHYWSAELTIFRTSQSFLFIFRVLE